MFRAQGKSIVEAVRLVFEHIEGSASVAVQFDDVNNLVLASNTGSLYMALSQNEKILVFASEKYILQQILNNKLLSDMFAGKSITQVKAGQGYLFDLTLSRKQTFLLKDSSIDNNDSDTLKSKANIFELYDQQTPTLPDSSQYLLHEDIKQTMIQNWEALYSSENVLKRCTRCLLPETMPYISFDEEGVCSYCRDYETRGNYLKGEKALEEFISQYRNNSGEPDVLIGFSGGRDSAFGLDYIKNTLRIASNYFHL